MWAALLEVPKEPWKRKGIVKGPWFTLLCLKVKNEATLLGVSKDHGKERTLSGDHDLTLLCLEMKKETTFYKDTSSLQNVWPYKDKNIQT